MISASLVRVLAEHAFLDTADGQVTSVVLPDGSAELTARELEVVTCLACGLNNREIAKRTFLSEASVETYLCPIAAKLGVRDRLQVLIRCYELGIVNPTLSIDDLPRP